MNVYVVRNKFSKRNNGSIFSQRSDGSFFLARQPKNYCYVVVANTKKEALNLFWEKELMKTQDLLLKKDFDVISIKTTSLKAFDAWNDEQGD